MTHRHAARDAQLSPSRWLSCCYEPVTRVRVTTRDKQSFCIMQIVTLFSDHFFRFHL